MPPRSKPSWHKHMVRRSPSQPSHNSQSSSSAGSRTPTLVVGLSQEPEEEPPTSQRLVRSQSLTERLYPSAQRLPHRIPFGALVRGELRGGRHGAVYVIWRLGDCVFAPDTFSGVHIGVDAWRGVLALTASGRYQTGVHRVRRVHLPPGSLALPEFLWAGVQLYRTEARRHHSQPRLPSLALEPGDLVEQWRVALQQREDAQLDYVDKVIRSAWVANLGELLQELDLARQWAEVIVLGVLWKLAPGSPPDEILVGLPSHIDLDCPEENYVTTNVYPAVGTEEEEEGTHGDLIQLLVLRVNAARIEALRDASPREESCFSFSGLLPGWLPDPAQTFALLDAQLYATDGVVLFLGGGSRVQECSLSLMSGAGALEEMYASAAEIDQSEACRALSLPHGSPLAPGTPVGGLLNGPPSRGQAVRGLSPTPGGQAQTRGAASKREARSGVTAAAAPAAKRPAAKAKAKCAAAAARGRSSTPQEQTQDAATLHALLNLVQGMAGRLEKLEGQGVAQAAAAPACSPSPVAHAAACAPAPSLLSRGRIPVPGPHPAGHAQGGATAGARAYTTALAEARSLLG
eukprot:268059-Amphidinium_carterae.1